MKPDDDPSAMPEPAELMPHAGAMVLIDEIVSWDEDQVHCRARIEDPGVHPLARAGCLPAEVLGEYGAQAMAVHGGLLDAQGRPRAGLLASLGRLALAIDHIDGPCTLDIRAVRLGGEASGTVYGFSVASRARELAAGQATVMFPDPAEAA